MGPIVTWTLWFPWPPVTASTGLAFGRSSDVFLVPSGIQVITVSSNSGVISQFSANLSFTHRNALTVGADTTQLSPVTPDTGAVISNRASGSTSLISAQPDRSAVTGSRRVARQAGMLHAATAVTTRTSAPATKIHGS